MKQLVTLLAIGVLSVFTYRTENCVVVNTDNDIATFESNDGNLYMIDKEDWMVNDVAKITFDTKGTVDRTDDEIISSIYIGSLR